MTPELHNCTQCDAEPGQFHVYGCGIERCPRCGMQQVSCPCIYEVNKINLDTLEDDHPEIWKKGATDEMYVRWDAEWETRRIPWSGEYPNSEECREYGMNHNELFKRCTWDTEKQRFILPS